MTTATAPVPAPVPAMARATAQTTVRRAAELPAWPLLGVVGGLPLWWVLGLTPFLPAAYLLVMSALILSLRAPGALRIPRGAGPLLAFVAWIPACAVMLDSALRVLGFAVRWSALAAAAVVVVHVANCSGLTTRRLLGAVAVVWGLVVVGGYLGMAWPNGGFTTPMAHLLPRAVLDNELVHDLLVPRFAEVQNPYGAAQPFDRPAAPFAYTNGWGWAVAFLTPVMLAFRARLTRSWARFAVLAGIAASVLPAVATRNRGMLVMIAAWLAVATVGLLVRGDLRGVAVVLGGGIVAVAGFAGLGLGGLIAERAAVSDSAGGRAEVYAATFTAALDSPVLGYGAPRGSEEIGVALGTQGAAWMYLFSYGFVGLALVVAFLVGVVVRSARLADPALLWLHAAVASACVALLFYGLDAIHLFVLGAVCGVLLREADPVTDSTTDPATDPATDFATDFEAVPEVRP